MTVNTIDWSATAAWIALVISITGTVVGPIVTSVLNNHHQLKMKKLELEESLLSKRIDIMKQCISGIGLVLAYPNSSNLTEFGKSFHNVYMYIPPDKWYDLDCFYNYVISGEIDIAKERCPEVIKMLTETLTALSQQNP